MKKYLLPLLFLFLLQINAGAQLRLESLDGNRSFVIPPGKEIGLKMPIWTANDRCDCGSLSNGTLVDYRADSISMRVREEIRIYALDINTTKKEETQYSNVSNRTVTSFLAKDALSLTVYSKPRKDLDNIGGALLLLSALQGLVTAPLLSDDARSISDKIVWAGIGVGFVLVVLPNSRTFYFQQPKQKPKPLWSIQDQ